MPVLVDSNVILDVVTQDLRWFSWSSQALSRWTDREGLLINPIIYAEVSVGFDRIEDLEASLPGSHFLRSPLPWEAAFLAGKCFREYRRRGGKRTSPLPDFYIGAHAAVGRLRLLTRDAVRYQTCFPGVELISPS